MFLSFSIFNFCLSFFFKFFVFFHFEMFFVFLFFFKFFVFLLKCFLFVFVFSWYVERCSSLLSMDIAHPTNSRDALNSWPTFTFDPRYFKTPHDTYWSHNTFPFKECFNRPVAPKNKRNAPACRKEQTTYISQNMLRINPKTIIHED